MNDDESRQGLMNDDENVEDFLEHFGVKGMKWGKRRSRSELQSAKESRSGGGKSAAKKAAAATAVVAGAALAATILRKSGGKPASAISGVGKAAASASANSGKVGKQWLKDVNTDGLDLFSSPYSNVARSQPSTIMDFVTQVSKK